MSIRPSSPVNGVHSGVTIFSKARCATCLGWSFGRASLKVVRFFSTLNLMEVLTLGNGLLKQKSEKVEKIDEETAEIIRKMFEAMKRDKGVGLAAPQVGIMKRIFVTLVEGDAERVFINPSILETSVKTTKYEEGCLSVPGIYANVVRAQSVKVQAWNEKGRPFTMETDGLLARVILHECDHLEGVVFLDHLPEQKRNKLFEKYEKKRSKEQAAE